MVEFTLLLMASRFGIHFKRNAIKTVLHDRVDCSNQRMYLQYKNIIHLFYLIILPMQGEFQYIQGESVTTCQTS